MVVAIVLHNRGRDQPSHHSTADDSKTHPRNKISMSSTTNSSQHMVVETKKNSKCTS